MPHVLVEPLTGSGVRYSGALGAVDRSRASAPPSYAIETRAGARWRVGGQQPQFVIEVADADAWKRIWSAGLYAVAIAFVDGLFDVRGDVVMAVRWWYQNHAADQHAGLSGLATRFRLERLFQTRANARRNVEFHYDRSNQFYAQFLDRRLIYSSGYFTDRSSSLDDAQAAKLDYIARKLELKAGDRFLDVGCGWGALVMHAVERCDALGTGCTLSGQQFDFAARAARERGLDRRAVIAHRDYRTLSGQFDKIASIGMYEHVGRRRLRPYFRTMAKLMAPDGLLLNSGIARPATVRDDAATLFLQRFVFPGGEIPYLGDVVRAAETAGLEVRDVENLREHYALTCASWVARLQQHRDACLRLVDARTYRTWLLYLAGSVVNFESGDSGLYQILFARRGRSAVRHLTRAYMYT
jgi:cyclopropane-fatty-acyl-phospholipid synthase